jgi:hypothetical protein
MVALLDIGSKIFIGKIHDIVRGVDVRTSEELHDVTRLILNGGLTTRCTYLRTLGVNEDTDVATDLAHVPYYIFYPLLRSVGSVHSDDIHTGVEQLTNEVNFTTTIAH